MPLTLKLIKTLFWCFSLFFIGMNAWGQCTASSDNGSSEMDAPANTTPSLIASDPNSGVYYTIKNIVSGATYRISLSSNKLITVTNTSNNVIVYGNGMVEFTATANMKVRIHIHDMTYGCKNYINGGLHTISGALNITCISCSGSYPPPPPNMFCQDAIPFCVGNKGDLTYTIQKNAGNAKNDGPSNNYGNTNNNTDNANWLYVESTQAGQLDFSIFGKSTSSTGSKVDLGVAFWGPFNNLSAAQSACGNLGSPTYSYYKTGGNQSSTQTINISQNVAASKVYILMVANKTNDDGRVAIATNSGNTAGTDCSETVLLIELTSFKGQPTAQGNLLQWEMATETNNDYFELASTIDGITYILIATVKGAGKYYGASQYQFLDSNPIGMITY